MELSYLHSTFTSLPQQSSLTYVASFGPNFSLTLSVLILAPFTIYVHVLNVSANPLHPLTLILSHRTPEVSLVILQHTLHFSTSHSNVTISNSMLCCQAKLLLLLL